MLLEFGPIRSGDPVLPLLWNSVGIFSRLSITSRTGPGLNEALRVFHCDVRICGSGGVVIVVDGQISVLALDETLRVEQDRD
jgi:hypothetical protein